MKRSKFSLSNYKIFTSEMGSIIPINIAEALPGDVFRCQSNLLVRVSPLLSPVMHPCRIRVHHFFVPNRIMWDDWEDFITGGDDGTFLATPPQITDTEVTESSLADYFGIPPGDYTTQPAGHLKYSALPHRAYALIFNEYFRDPDLTDELVVATESGLDVTTNRAIQNACWEKDYFTAARPFEQKGDDTYIPLGSRAPITGIGVDIDAYQPNPLEVRETGGTIREYAAHMMTNQTGVAMVGEEDPDNPGYPSFYADLSQATGITVNELRQYLAEQRFKEARSRYGSKYEDYLRYLGVRPQDARLQNPEFLSGGSNILQFSEVLSTDGENTGDLKGHGIAAVRSNRFRRYIPEHGIIMSLMSVIPKAIYSSTVNKMFLRETKEDYFQKELQYLGDEIITNEEIQANNTQPTETFGWQQRYDSYRFAPSTIAGEFRTTLNYWHYAREFTGDVALNDSFVKADPTKRVYASTNTHPLYVMAQNSVQARRMLKGNPTPRTF